MRAWHGLVLWLLLTAALRLVVGDASVWTAPEVDTLEAGVTLAEHLTSDDGGLRDRLALGFAVDPEQPRAADLPDNHPWRRAVAEPPVPKWLAAASVMLAPTSADTPNQIRAATGAAAALALAAVLLLGVLWRRDRLVAVVAAVGLLLQPGALDAAGASGYGAAAALTLALLFVAAVRLCGAERGGGVAIGAAWGLTLGVHPGAAFLIIPVFVAYAIARRSPARRRPDERGMLALPAAPVTLFAAPLIGLVVLVALWPALWDGTGKRLGAWLMDNWWLFNPGYDVGGVVFDQANDRAAMAWAGLAQWAGWHAIPLTVAFVAGVVRVVQRGRDGLWFPVLAWVTLMLVGAGDGGLFGGRLSLMPLLWVPSAVIIALGVRQLVAVGAGLFERQQRAVLAVTLVVVLALPMGGALAGAPLAPWSTTGASLARPLPVALLREVASQDPGARIHITPAPTQWRATVDAARDHLELPLTWAGPATADWVIHIGSEAPPESRRAPRWQSTVFGLPIVARGPTDDARAPLPRREGPRAAP